MTLIEIRSGAGRKIYGLTFVVAALYVFAASASAAPAPAPSFKVLGAVAPTNIPPQQSETQRLIVEAEGGTYTLSVSRGVKGRATPVFAEAKLKFTEGENVAKIESLTGGNGGVEVGDTVVAPGQESGPTILSCKPDCETPGSELELSEAAAGSETGAQRLIFTRELDEATGEFVVGEEVVGKAFSFESYYPPGTTVTAVGTGTVTLSNPPAEYASTEGSIEIVSAQHTTQPIAFNASPEALQAALTAALGAGTATVVGGPGGVTESPYYVQFAGTFGDRDVTEFRPNSSGLTGPHPYVHANTTLSGGLGTGEIVVLPANIGGAPSSGTITAKIGPLPPGIVTAGPSEGIKWLCPGGAGETTVTCTTAQTFRALHSTENSINVPIEVSAGAAPNSSVAIELYGGGAATPTSYQVPIVISNEPASFGVAAAWGGAFEADGSPSIQAGGHPFQASAYVMLNSRRSLSAGSEPIAVAGDPKEFIVDLPPGLIGNPLVGKRCPQSLPLPPVQGFSELCNEEMAIGILQPVTGSLAHSKLYEPPLINDIPPQGFAAEFSTRIVYILQSVVVNIDPEEGFTIRLTGPNNPLITKIFGVFAAFEGVPKLGNGKPLLTNPVNCSETAASPSAIHAQAASYQEPDNVGEFFSLPQPPVVGCDRLKFEAQNPITGEGQVGFSFAPSAADGSPVSAGSSPVGAIAHLHIDQGGLTDPAGLATPELKRAVIKLPAGLSLNPSQSNGLEGCSESQIGYLGSGFSMPSPMRFNEAQPTCPDGSQLGTAEIRTPLLDNPLVGQIYLADRTNPFGSLLAVYLVVNDPYTGVLVKLPGELRADATTGRLTAIFDYNPQLPFEDLYLRFRGGGPRSEFATSEVCGDFPTEGEWTPWSAPESGPPAQTYSAFSITSNCSTNPAARGFAPTFEAGTTSVDAGNYAPLVVKVARRDGEQELTNLDFTLPRGLIGKLAGIPYCSDAAIAAARSATGRAERAQSSCPSSSRLGSVTAGAGVGPAPFYVGGTVYLAGPYKGAPVSAVAIVPALAGPLDLGDVVIRTPLYIDRETAQLTAKTDRIPTILEGIPLKIRSIAILVDRPGFILNPTNCEPAAATGVITGGSGAVANPRTRFQAAGCKALKFAPKLKIRLKGKTKRNAKPALTAILTQKAGGANIGRIAVALPHSEFLEQGHIGTVCTRPQFAADQCPPRAIYGHAEAVTPLLGQPLRGPVYLRSSTHQLPDLVAALKGPAAQPIEIDLDGRIDSFKGGLRTTFETAPDAPVSRFVLRMLGGKKGLLVNSTNICDGKNRAKVLATGQNGKEHDFQTVVEPECGGKSKGHRRSRGANK